jgi:hypothetical protein
MTDRDITNSGGDEEEVSNGEEEEDQDELSHERIGDRVIRFEVIPEDLVAFGDALSRLEILGAAVDRGSLELVDSQGLE